VDKIRMTSCSVTMAARSFASTLSWSLAAPGPFPTKPLSEKTLTGEIPETE
jgi:hypothetical protein